jgi:hypothetical protein
MKILENMRENLQSSQLGFFCEGGPLCSRLVRGVWQPGRRRADSSIEVLYTTKIPGFAIHPNSLPSLYADECEDRVSSASKARHSSR